jgi:transcriptional regulator with XRE-family HTH domain
MPDIDTTTLAFNRWFTAQRKERNLTILETSGLAGVSDATLSRIENNLSSITVRTAKKNCCRYGRPFVC